MPDYARALIEEFWPGPLTLVCPQQPSLQWDLGDSRGRSRYGCPTTRSRCELLERTGPLAVSSANRTGLPAATVADQAEEMLGERVAVISTPDDARRRGLNDRRRHRRPVAASAPRRAARSSG